MADFTIPSTVFAGGDATSYDLPNYVGELYDLMPQITPFTTMIGGLNGGREVSSRDFTWQVEDGEEAAGDQQQFENASVTGDLIPRQPISNVVEIHMEGVEFGYTAQAVMEQLGPLAPHATLGVVQGDQPVRDPMAHQINKKIGKIKRDLEVSFLTNTFAQGTSDNTTTKRKTRGMLTAIDTHKVDYTTGSYTSIRDAIDDLLLDMAAPTYEANSSVFMNPVIMINPAQSKAISNDYTNDGLLAPRDRHIGGVAVRTIVTEQGEFAIVTNRFLPAGNLLVLDVDYIRPVFLPIPGKGVFFAEPLAKTKATDAIQIYGEVGLEYGPETYHGKITLIT